MELALIPSWTSNLRAGIFCFSQHLGIPSQLAALKFVGKILASAQSERQDCKRRVLVSRRNEARAVGDEYVFDLMHLAESVQYRRFRIVAHAGGTQFVNDPSGSGHLAPGRNDFRTG